MGGLPGAARLQPYLTRLTMAILNRDEQVPAAQGSPRRIAQSLENSIEIISYEKRNELHRGIFCAFCGFFVQKGVTFTVER
jgi:hypothetical protein